MEALELTAVNLARIKTAAGQDLPEIAREIQAGEAQFIDCNGCAFVLRAEGSEMVIVCGEGRGAVAAAAILKQKAIERGYKTVRFHTSRPALQRLLKKYGFFEAERVYRTVLDG